MSMIKNFFGDNNKLYENNIKEILYPPTKCLTDVEKLNNFRVFFSANQVNINISKFATLLSSLLDNCSASTYELQLLSLFYLPVLNLLINKSDSIQSTVSSLESLIDQVELVLVDFSRDIDILKNFLQINLESKAIDIKFLKIICKVCHVAFAPDTYSTTSNYWTLRRRSSKRLGRLLHLINLSLILKVVAFKETERDHIPPHIYINQWINDYEVSEPTQIRPDPVSIFPLVVRTYQSMNWYINKSDLISKFTRLAINWATQKAVNESSSFMFEIRKKRNIAILDLITTKVIELLTSHSMIELVYSQVNSHPKIINESCEVIMIQLFWKEFCKNSCDHQNVILMAIGKIPLLLLTKLEQIKEELNHQLNDSESGNIDEIIDSSIKCLYFQFLIGLFKCNDSKKYLQNILQTSKEYSNSRAYNLLMSSLYDLFQNYLHDDIIFLFLDTDIILELPKISERDEDFQRQLSLKYLKNYGWKQLVYSSDEQILSCMRLLDEIFAFRTPISTTSNNQFMEQSIKRYLDPLITILQGGQQAHRSSNRDSKPSSYIPTIAHIFKLLLLSDKYNQVTFTSNDIETEWHLLLNKIFQNKCLLTPPLSVLLFPNTCDTSHTINPTLFDTMIEVEMKMESHRISPIFLTLTTAYGDALFKYEEGYLTNQFNGVAFANRLLKMACDHIYLYLSKSKYSNILISYLHSAWKFNIQFINANKYDFPALIRKFYEISEKFLSIIPMEHQLVYHTDRIRECTNQVRALIQNVINDIDAKKISNEELDLLEKMLTPYREIAEGFAIQNMSLINPLILETLRRQLQKESILNEELGNVWDFLQSRNLLFDANNNSVSRTTFIFSNNSKIMLTDIIAKNLGLLNIFDLDSEESEDVLLALRAFSKGCSIFSNRFNEHMAKLHPHLDIKIITRQAVAGLRQLVTGENVRISNFSGEGNLRTLMTELQQKKRSTMAIELQRIAKFFSSESISDDNMNIAVEVVGGSSQALDVSLERLNASFELIRYRESLRGFKTSLRDLSILDQHTTEIIKQLDTNQALTQVHQDFLLSEAPTLLKDIRAAVGDLRPWDLVLIGRLTSATLLLEFLRRHGAHFESGSLERAQNRAAADGHATSILLKLIHIRNLLLPFYSRSLSTLAAIREHLKQYISPVTTTSTAGFGDGQEDAEPIAITELNNISENWSLVEFYFRDGTDSQAGAEVVERLVLVYLESGQYLSSLRRSETGASLSFTYSTRNNIRHVLPSNILQDQVQGALLAQGTSKEKDLLEFVESYHLAVKAHEVRLQLEKAGHPSHQIYENDAPTLLSKSIRRQDLMKSRQYLEGQFVLWETNTKDACARVPRLMLLNRYSRTHFLIACRNLDRISDNITNGSHSLLPYIIQCFPSQIHSRHALIAAIEVVLHQGNFMSDQHGFYSQEFTELTTGVNIIINLELVLGEVISSPLSYAGNENEMGSILRLHLPESTPTDVYCEHLSDSLSATDGLPVVPGQVLWGSPTVEIDTIRDWIQSATIPGLCSTMHVINVQMLNARVREELLRALQSSSTICCPVVLIFGDLNGSEAFLQYDSMSPTHTKPSQLSNSLWINYRMNPPQPESAIANVKVWVVSGATGMGKTHWIQKNFDNVNCNYLHFVIHEGFLVTDAINKYRKLTSLESTSTKIMVIHFDISSYGDLELFGRFLHHLLTVGLLIDESSGLATFIHLGIEHRIYIELPALADHPLNIKGSSNSSSNKAITWPNHESKFSTFSHPFISQYFPVLAVAVPPSQFIAIPATTAYTLDAISMVVGSYLDLYFNHNDVDAVQISNQWNKAILDADCLLLLQRYWREFDVHHSKLVRRNTMLLLYTRIEYLRNIANCINQPSEFQTSLIVRFNRKNSFRDIIELFLNEAGLIASCSPKLPDVMLWTIRPDMVLDGFDVLITVAKRNDRLAAWAKLFMSTKVLTLKSGKIPADVRALVAPAFNMDNTADMVNTLRDCGHLLTADSLVRLLHLHGRREIGASVIYEGETGVGKSQNLHLYSYLINASSTLFTNLKLHMMAVLQAYVASNLEVTDVDDDADEVWRNARQDILQLDTTYHSTTVEALIELIVTYVRYDISHLTNSVGAAICSYFEVLYQSYPLHREGLSEGVRSVFKKFRRVAAISPEITDAAKAIALQATIARYTPFRPAPGTADDDWLGMSTSLETNEVDSQQQDLNELQRVSIQPKTNRKNNEITVYVKLPTGKQIAVNVDPSQTILQIKKMLHENEQLTARNLRPEEIQLSYRAKVLLDNDTVLNCGIQHESTLHITSKDSMLLPGQDNAQTPLVNTLFSGESDFRDFIQSLLTSPPAALYHRILADEGLTPARWKNFLIDIITTAQRLQTLSPGAVVCVFVDELNTAGCLGMVAEAFTNHTLNGAPLPNNIFFVGAINPLRQTANNLAMDFTKSNLISRDHEKTSMDINVLVEEVINLTGEVSLTNNTLYSHSNSSRQSKLAIEDEHEEDEDLSALPYIVRALPPSLSQFRIEYPRLGSKNLIQNRAFSGNSQTWNCQMCTFSNSIYRTSCEVCDNPATHLNQDDKDGDGDSYSIAELSFLEEFFDMHVSLASTPRGFNPIHWLDCTDTFPPIATRMIARAQSLVSSYSIPRVFVSIRDLLRAVKLFRWFITQRVPTARNAAGEVKDFRMIFLPKEFVWLSENAKSPEYIFLHHALLMSLAVTYWFRLPSSGHVVVGKSQTDFRLRFIRDMSDEWCTMTCHFDFEKVEAKAKFIQDFELIVNGSLDHLWSYAKIPQGLAHTYALKENFYAMVLSANIGMPLLITGPPGCGKTLSFNLASENLKGNAQNHSVAFQHLKKLHKFPYQCSAESSAAELAMVYTRAMENQQALDKHDAGRHVCVVGMDEAGLPPERRQALKAVHDVLERNVVGTVMMSNITLDAAKTSRAIQLLQTPANMEDLQELCRGLLLDEDLVPMNSDTSYVKAGVNAITFSRIRWLCEAFYQLNTVIPKGKNWFHSRDFVFLCRYLKKITHESGRFIPDIFDGKMLLLALRRHFQMPDPSDFPLVAGHFLKHCQLDTPEGDKLDAQVIPSLLASLQDTVGDADPTSAHCRYTLVVDPTDCETAVDLLFSLKLLQQNTTRIVSMSNFPEDVTPTQRTSALAQIKQAIELGETLLLVNAEALHTPLYDVINRHYAISFSSTGEREAYANIALGSFSRYVRVHKDFRLVLHIPASRLATTPLPLLNRLEKYTLSIREAYERRLSEVALNLPFCLRSLKTPKNCEMFFSAIEEGVQHFATFFGGSSSFYGISLKEFIPSLILRALEDSCSNSSSGNNGMNLEFRNSWELDDIVTIVNRANKDNGLAFPETTTSSNEESLLGNYNEWGSTGTTNSHSFESSTSTFGRLRKCIRTINIQLLQVARVEAVYHLRRHLPAIYLIDYLKRHEHFTVINLLQKLLKTNIHSNARIVDKLVVYTRTDSQVLQFSHDEIFATNFLNKRIQKYLFFNGINQNDNELHVLDTTSNSSKIKTYIINALPHTELVVDQGVDVVVLILALSMFHNSTACGDCIRWCMQSKRYFESRGVHSVLIMVVVDMKCCTASQVTFARHMVDEESGKFSATSSTRDNIQSTSAPLIVFLLHVPNEQRHLRSCYQLLPINGWDAMYVDSFSDGDDSYTENGSSDGSGLGGSSGDDYVDHSLDMKGWMLSAFSLTRDTNVVANKRSFGPLVYNALQRAVSYCKFKQPRQLGHRRINYNNMGIVLSRPAYEDGDSQLVYTILTNRTYLMSVLIDLFSLTWENLLEHTVTDVCSRIESGITSKGFLESIRQSYSWLLSDFLIDIVRRELSAEWSLEALAKLPENKDMDNNILVHENNLVNSYMNLAGLLLKSLIEYETGKNSLHGIESVQRSGGLFHSNLVDCSHYFHPSITPLFHSFMKQLRSAIAESLQNVRTNYSSDNTQLEQDVLFITSYMSGPSSSASASANVGSTTAGKNVGRWSSLLQAMNIIENDPSSWRNWTLDYVSLVVLQEAYSPMELNLLAAAAEAMVAKSYSLFARSRESISVDSEETKDQHDYYGNVLSWILLENTLRSHLYEMTTALHILREVLTPEDIEHILNIGEKIAKKELSTHNHQNLDKIMDMAMDIEVSNVQPPAGKSRNNVSKIVKTTSSDLSYLDLLLIKGIKILWVNIQEIASTVAIATGYDEHQQQKKQMFKKQRQKLDQLHNEEDIRIWMRSIRDLVSGIFSKFCVVILAKSLKHLCQYACMLTLYQFLGMTADPRLTVLLLSGFHMKQNMIMDRVVCPLEVTCNVISNLHKFLKENNEIIDDIMPVVIIESLRWMLFTKQLLRSVCPSAMALLLAALTGSTEKLDQHKGLNAAKVIQQYLPLGAKLELLKLILADSLLREEDEGTMEANDVSNMSYEILNDLLTDDKGMPVILPIFPSFVKQSTAVVTKRIADIIPDHPNILLPIISSHSIVFTAYSSLSTQPSQSTLTPLEYALRSYVDFRNDHKHALRDSAAALIRHSVFSLILVDSAADVLSTVLGIANITEEEVLDSIPKETRQMLREIIEISPRAWGVYLLSRLPNLALTTSLIHNEPLLQELGMKEWFTKKLSEQGVADVNQGLEIVRSKEILWSKLVSVEYAKVTVDYYLQQQYMQPVSMFFDSSTPTLNDNQSIQVAAAMNLTKKLLDRSMASQLSANRHIPVFARMYSFIIEKMSYLFTLEEVQELYFEQALKRLPLADRLEGDKLFKSFLSAWKEVRQEFDTFVQCRREGAAAAAIPELTDMRGNSPVRLSYLVELDSDEKESGPARILTQRLLLQTAALIRDTDVETLRNDPVFNKYEWLGEKQSSTAALSCLQGNNQNDVFITGPIADNGNNTASACDIDSIVMMYATWVADSPPPPTTPYDSNNNNKNNIDGGQIDVVAAIAAAQEAAARASQTLAHAQMMVICPNCRQIGERQSGCDVLKCGGVASPYAPVEPGKGCGTMMNFVTNRVPVAIPGQPLHPFFLPVKATIPATLLTLGPLPVITPPSGHYQFDWEAIAGHLFSKFIAGRPEILAVYKGMDFFTSLPLRIGTTNNMTKNSGLFRPHYKSLNPVPIKLRNTSQDLDQPKGSATTTNISLQQQYWRSSFESMPDVLIKLQLVSQYLSSTKIFKQLHEIHEEIAVISLSPAEDRKITSLLTSFGESERDNLCEQLLGFCTELYTLCTANTSTGNLNSNLTSIGITEQNQSSSWRDILQINTIQELFTMISKQYFVHSSSLQVNRETTKGRNNNNNNNNNNNTTTTAASSTILLRMIGTIPARKIIAIINQIVDACCSTAYSNWPSLNASLPRSEALRVASIIDHMEDKYVDDNTVTPEQLSTILADAQAKVQLIGSSLTANAEHILLAADENTPLRKLSFISTLLHQDKNVYCVCTAFLSSDNILVKHYGPIMRAMRASLGKLSQIQFSILQSSLTKKLHDDEEAMKEEVEVEDHHSKKVTKESPESDHVLYSELVHIPSDWMSLQQEESELCYQSAETLKQRRTDELLSRNTINQVVERDNNRNIPTETSKRLNQDTTFNYTNSPTTVPPLYEYSTTTTSASLPSDTTQRLVPSSSSSIVSDNRKNKLKYALLDLQQPNTAAVRTIKLSEFIHKIEMSESDVRYCIDHHIITPWCHHRLGERIPVTYLDSIGKDTTHLIPLADIFTSNNISEDQWNELLNYSNINNSSTSDSSSILVPRNIVIKGSHWLIRLEFNAWLASLRELLLKNPYLSVTSNTTNTLESVTDILIAIYYIRNQEKLLESNIEIDDPMEIENNNVSSSTSNTMKRKVMSPIDSTILSNTINSSEQVLQPSKIKTKIYPKNLKRTDFEKLVGISSHDLEYLISNKIVIPITIPKIGKRFLESDVVELFERLCTVEMASDLLGIPVEDFLEAVAVDEGTTTTTTTTNEMTALRLMNIQDKMWMIKSAFYDWFNIEEDKVESETDKEGVKDKDTIISNICYKESDEEVEVISSNSTMIGNLLNDYNNNNNINNNNNNSSSGSDYQDGNENDWNLLMSGIGVREEKKDYDS